MKTTADVRTDGPEQGVELALGQADLGAMLLQSLQGDPDRCAFRFKGADITRGQLLNSTLALAARLRDAGLRSEMPVLIEIEHSLELVIAMCSVQVVGACAIPIDPAISAERQDAILADIGPALKLKHDVTRQEVEIHRVASTDREFPAFETGLAFIVYTSGSSGGAKGAMIAKDGYVERLRHIVPGILTRPGDIDLAWTPSSFITMIDEIFLPLLAGMPTVIAGSDIRTNPHAFVALVQREGVTTFRITPSLLELVLRAAPTDALAKIRTILTSGEATSAALRRRVDEMTTASLIGFYGATEAPAAAYSTFDNAADQGNAGVYNPQPFVPLRIVGQDTSEVPIGHTGEIWIGGCAVARGYFGQPELTSAKFVTQNSSRWFRTGDLARRLEGGAVEILGRLDLSEVNIHGVRVNLPEVRAALLKLENIQDAWVSAVAPQDGSDPILVGHCLTAKLENFNSAAVKAAVSITLPSPSVPRFVMAHAQFPLTANGKLDLQGLARDARELVGSSSQDPQSRALVTLDDTPEINALLQVVIETAQDILKTRDLTPEHSFFESGGTSLLAVHFALVLSEKLDVELASTLVFNTGSLAEIVTLIASGQSHAVSTLKLLRAGDTRLGPLISINATGGFSALAAHLTGPYAVYNANIFGLTNELVDVLDTVTLNELADRIARQIMSSFPTEPYKLIAYCQDGCLAVETARILRERHGAECSLLLVDTFFLKHRSTPKMWFMCAVDFGPGYFVEKLKAQLRPKVTQKRFGETSLARKASLMAKSQNDHLLYQRYKTLFMSYDPTAIDCQVSLFISREWRHADLSSAQKLSDVPLGVRHVEGLHNTLFKAEAVAGLAEAVDETMSEASTQRDQSGLAY